jgi:RNA polymerase sigma factor (TIGR02999 family)
MHEVTRILSAIEQGDPQATEKLLPLVYDELRRLAAEKLAQEKPGQTLQATALVHEAYVRLARIGKTQHWNSRGHFFAAAAEAMRRILVEQARRKTREKRGGARNRVELDDVEGATGLPSELLLALSDALEKLGEQDAQAAELVKMRCFAGLSLDQTAEALGLSRTNAYRQWVYARAWLYSRIANDAKGR